MSPRVVQVAGLGRIEGEAGLRVRLHDGEVSSVELRVFEPPRLFEALLRGRRFDEVPDIVARICGICPVAHQLTAIASLEQCCNVEVDPAIAALRRLMYLGEWIESHALHVYVLHAPDFLNADDVLQFARTNRAIVERGLRLKQIGNHVVAVVGGREIHPVNLRVGGMYRVPEATRVAALADELKWAREAAVATVEWAAGLTAPAFEQEYEYVSLCGETGYPLLDGRIRTSRGGDFGPSEFEEHFREEQVSYSTALRAAIDGQRPYIVGPLARFALNHDRLGAPAREAAEKAGLAAPCKNPFLAIVVRAVELVEACDAALAIVERYEPPRAPGVVVSPRAARSAACTEAPRGLLYHRYTIDSRGVVLDARIVPPTAQNQRMMERDLGAFVAAHADLPDAELTRRCEQAVRNYDPCISCSAHFLRLEVVRCS